MAAGIPAATFSHFSSKNQQNAQNIKLMLAFLCTL
jgi:hypothetical protein